MLSGDLRFDTAPSGTVARDDDRPFDGYAEAIELFVVLAVAVVDVDERARDIAIGGVGVVSEKLFAGLIRCWIDGQDWLLHLGLERLGREHFEDSFFRRGEENLES